MTNPKRCGQCERFAWHSGYGEFGCLYGLTWTKKTAFSKSCKKIRPKEYLDPRHDPDPLPPDPDDKKQIHGRYPSWSKLEDSLL